MRPRRWYGLDHGLMALVDASNAFPPMITRLRSLVYTFVECASSSDVHQITCVTEFMRRHGSPVGSGTESHAGKEGAKRGIDETESRLVGEVFFRSQDVDAQVAFCIAICHAIVSCQGKALVGITTL